MQTNGGQLALGDLLAEEAFGLEMLTGGDTAQSRPVHGAHAVEVEAPTRWLAGHWVMLTAGVRLRSRPGDQRALVRELDEAGVTALGFGVGLGFKRVPGALVAEADARGFPIFEVPYETAFREIIRFVDSSLLGGELHVFRRLSALQRYLVDAIRDTEPERAVVERLARFLDSQVVIFTEDGEIEATTGEPPAGALWQEIARQPPGLLELRVAGWHAVAAPVAAHVDRPARWLVLTSRRPGFITKLIKPAAETAAPLLSALSRVGDVVRAQEDAVKGALLDEALAPLEAEEQAPLAARAAAFGIDLSEPARVVVVQGRSRPRDGAPEPDLAPVRRDLVARLEHLRAPYLVTRRADSLVVLVQGPAAEVRPVFTGVADAHPDVVVGIGRAIDAIVRAQHSLRDAELAVDRVRLEPSRQLLDFEDFDLGTFVVSEVAPERLGPKVDEILSVLQANPALHETLLAYFEHDLDIVAAAAELHLHPNSLRYRLSQIEKLLGRSLKQPSTITALYIAVVAGSTTSRLPSSNRSSH